MSRERLKEWVPEALQALGGKAKVIDVAKQIWKMHSKDLSIADDLFFTWQYDMRWAALTLRDKGVLEEVDELPRGVWALKV
ncbi:MAG: hypothetical protein EON61_10660 [Alphaproteobacteria bacterium]|nr:MAG: hypothetical protein EON61_10660 [Alphaproteobacteria bacterium]